MRILIVEDNAADRELLLELLQDHFMKQAKFRMATNIRDAFEYLERRHSHPSIVPGIPPTEAPYFDCVILDLQLPDSMGRETFRSIHRRFPDLPIVIVSHNKDQQLALDLIREGAQDFILKDYTNTTDIFRRVLFAVERQRNIPISSMPPKL